ncbi:Exopolyphosphatase [hydrothermal vent metagenome]|uniref:Exopolyphosphatase n=1 Tax=hydrothermal vent metagenome TaxID=652676 RepID=A0A1W1BA61_9ZZZZ
MAKVTAVIDIGSNSARMVVYKKSSRFAFHMLNETKSKVRISENAYKNGGNLQEEPMQRAYEALCGFLKIAKSYKARKILCVATSALRDAPNRQIFLKRVRNGLGLNIKVIDGAKEALFGGIAAANLLPPQKNAITVDIGGGSTEFAIINGKDVHNPISLDLGAVRLKELFFDKGDIKGATAYIDKELEKLQNIDSIDTIIGIGGSFRALSLALMSMEEYPLQKLHAYEPDFKKFKKLLSSILEAKSPKELKKLSIKDERLDVIAPGALILSRIIKKLSIKRLITSGVGVREGVYLSDILRTSALRFPENFNPSVRYLLDAYIEEKKHANLLNKLAKEIFDLVHKELDIDVKYRYHTALAAKLFPVGSTIHYYSKNKHSYYIIQATLEYGFSHFDTMLIATLTRYAKRKLPSKEHYEKYKKLLPKKDTLDKLSFIVSVAIALLTHRPCKIDFSMHFSKEAVEKLKSLKEFEVLFY